MEITRRKIGDAPGAEAAVKEALQAQYGTSLKSVSFRKCWFSASGKLEYWDVEGTFIRSRGFIGREARNFRYQVDPDSGRIIGYELMTLPQPRK